MRKNNNFGFIDITGTTVIDLKYENAWHFSEGLAAVSLNSTDNAYINTKGEIVLNFPNTKLLGYFSEGLAPVMYSNKSVYIDKTGKIAIEHGSDMVRATYSDDTGSFDYIRGDMGSFSDGRAASRSGKKIVCIDKSGKIIFGSEYDSIGSDINDKLFNDGLCVVRKDNKDGIPKYGFVDINGSVVSEIQWDSAQNYSNGLALVAKKLKDSKYEYYYLNKEGQVALGPFKGATNFSEGLAVVTYDEGGLVSVTYTQNGRTYYGSELSKQKWGIINTKGDYIVKSNIEANKIYQFSEGIATIEKKLENNDKSFEQYGAIDNNGKIIIEYGTFGDFGFIGKFNNGLAIIKVDDKQGSKCGLIKYTGNNLSNSSVDSTKNIKIIFVDKELKLSPPINKNDRNYYQFTELLDSIGATVEWDAETSTAIGILKNNRVEFTLNSNTYKINGTSKTMEKDVVPFSKNGKIYIPIKHALEAFGFSVNWDSGSNSILVD